jgi:RimJ/RimL family protein N-acetyltransferase
MANNDHDGTVLRPPSQLALSDFMLRALSPADTELLRAALAASDAHLRRWTPWVVDGRVAGQSLEERLANHAAKFAAGNEWVYGLLDLDATEMLGGCGLYPRVGPGAVEIGYWIAVGQTGRGLATRAAWALTEIAFGNPTIERIEIRCDHGNAPSARVPERLGYCIMDPAPANASSNLQVWTLSRAEFAARDSSSASRATSTQ